MKSRDSNGQSISFENVLSEELTEIDSIRNVRLDTGGTNPAKSKNSGDIYEDASERKLIGLAFSGGGIRSATFNLGILQGLAEHTLLCFFDYLSTVSGGGYVGSWLTAWISREKSVKTVEERLHSKTLTGSQLEDHRPIQFLRRYSNYLTPRVGMFSADTWAFLSVYLRNLFLNLAVYLPFLVAILLLPLVLTKTVSDLLSHPDTSYALFFGIFPFFLGLSGFFAGMNISCGVSRGKDPWYSLQISILFSVVLPLAISALFGSLFVWYYHDVYRPYWDPYAFISGMIYLLCWMAGCLVGRKSTKSGTDKNRAGKQSAWQPRLIACSICMVFSGVLWIALFYLTSRILNLFDRKLYYYIWYIMIMGLPLMFLVYMAVTTFQIGLFGRYFPDEKREWWSRLGGWLFIFMVIWLGFFGLTVFGPPALVWIQGAGISLIGTGWISSTLFGVLAGKSPATGKAGSNKWLELAAKIAPCIFVVGLLLLCTTVMSVICIKLSGKFDTYWDAIWVPNDISFSNLLDINTYFMASINLEMFLLALGVCLLAVLVLSWRIDINQFSTHLMYRNRLVRCYLGASNPRRHPQPFTGFDPEDDVSLVNLQNAKSYDGPYHIINTTLNLVGGKELAWQKRKAASFVFTPKFSGYELARAKRKDDLYVNTTESSYCKTGEYSNGQGINIGEAMAISGAALSPNMGYHSSKALSFLMTVFNVRLGWWCGNPKFPDQWKKAGTPWGIWYLMAELFGKTNEKLKYVYLSDGGHFENLGIYELVRRRCRFIVACDASQDPDKRFEDLGNAIRKVRVDLGVSIDINVSHLKGKSSDKKCCAVGTIHYKKDDGSAAEEGKLIYIKPTLCGNEPVDILNYAKTHTSFPHQSTGDQWFDEVQFESYRMLGYHSVFEICGKDWQGKTFDDFLSCAQKYAEEGDSRQ